MTILFIIGALGLGRLVVKSLPLTWFRAEEYALIVLFGFYFGSWLLLIACTVFGFEIGAIITITLMLAAWIPLLNKASNSGYSPINRRQTIVWLTSTASISVIVGSLIFRQMIEPGKGGVYSAGATLIDLPLHLSIITNVAYAHQFNWHFSLMAHTYLTYHFLIDFLNGMFFRWSGDLRNSLLLVSFAYCLALVQLLFFAGYRTTRSFRSAGIFSIIFCFGGSSFGFLLAIFAFFHSRMSFHSFLITPPQDYEQIMFEHFDSFVSANLIDQRGFQIGVPVICSMILLICRLSEIATEEKRNHALVLMGIISGLLPLAHIYSFLAGFGILVIFTVIHPKTAPLTRWYIAIITCASLAAPQLLYQVFANKHAITATFHPGWMFTYSSYAALPYYLGMFLFILTDFGIVFLLTIMNRRYTKRNTVVYRLVILGSFLFIISFAFIFQPLAYDNIKFLAYAYMFFCFSVAQYLSQISRTRLACALSLTLLFIASGLLSIMWQMHQRMLLFTNKDFVMAEECHSALPAEALVLSSTGANNPIWSLAGQTVVEGRFDYLWDYGLPAQKVQDDINAIFQGKTSAPRLLQQYRIQYVLISPFERSQIRGLNEVYFLQRFPMIFHRDGVEIFKIRQ